jgi:hypothetical protein
VWGERLEAFSFTDATVVGTKARIAISGGAGSGKTYTALLVATALAQGGKVFLLDTEKRSASKYANEFKFRTNEREFPDYSPDTYVAGIRAAEKSGADVIVIDSASHEWFGRGGCLDMVDKAQGSNRFAGWKDVTPKHNKFVEAILNSPCHVIATFRAKTDYLQIQDVNGRTKIQKVGLAAITRDGMDFEFDIFGEMDANHVMSITKTRCRVLTDKQIEKPGEEFGRIVLDWLSEAKALPVSSPSAQMRPVQTWKKLSPKIVERMMQVHDDAKTNGWEPPLPPEDADIPQVTEWAKRVPLMVVWIKLFNEANGRNLNVPEGWEPDFTWSVEGMSDTIQGIKDIIAESQKG